MSAPASLHPTDQTLDSFRQGKLDTAAAEAVSAHLVSCAACRARVAGVSSAGAAPRRPGPQAQGRPETPPPMGSSLDDDPRILGKVPDAPPPPETLPPGLADHPDYQVLRELGRGGMGIVYLAHNQLMGRDEVLKVMGRHIIEKPGVLDRFLREIRAVARLRHPNIVTAYSAFRLGDSIAFAMEYVDGYDLSRLVKDKGPLSVAHASHFIYQAALGLQHAYEEGMVHRDIKPGNLMLSRKGDRPTIKILDFGLAKATREQSVDTALTREGQMLGTPDFIAPEQTIDAQKADIRADIYSLGCTLYYLLNGGPPFRASSLYEILQAHHSADAKPLNLVRRDVPVELAALAGKMMAKDPDQRFQTPAEVAKALVPFFKAARAASSVPKGEPSPAIPPDHGTWVAPATPPLKPPTAAATPVRAPAPAAETSSSSAAALASGRRPAWIWPAVAAGATALGLLSAWAGGVFKGKASNETAAPKSLPGQAAAVADRKPVPVPNQAPAESAPVVAAPRAEEGKAEAKNEADRRGPGELAAAGTVTGRKIDVEKRFRPVTKPKVAPRNATAAAVPPKPTPIAAAELAAPRLATLPAGLPARASQVDVLRRAIKVLNEMKFGRARDKDAIRDRAIGGLEEAIGRIAMGETPMIPLPKQGGAVGRIAKKKTPLIPLLRQVKEGIEGLEARTLNPDGRRRFDEVVQLIDLAIDMLRRGVTRLSPSLANRPVERPRAAGGADAGAPKRETDFRRLSSHTGPFKLVADPGGRAPGPFWPELGPNTTEDWQIGDPGAIKMTLKELMLWAGPGGNLLLTRRDDFKKCSISVALAVNDDTEAYLALRAHHGPDGWRAITSRIIGQGGKVRAGLAAFDFQAEEQGKAPAEKMTRQPFRMKFLIDEKGAARVYVGNELTASINDEDHAEREDAGAAGLFVKSGKILIESLVIREQ
jgi:serine/threonine protein kinase